MNAIFEKDIKVQVSIMELRRMKQNYMGQFISPYSPNCNLKLIPK